MMMAYPFRLQTLELLEEFFADNQNPNEAEIDLLARVGRVASGHIVRWCKLLGKADRVVHY